MLFEGRTWLVLAFLIALPASAAAQVGQVGVASVAIGDPLSKPPQQAERVLRVGVDVFASERISTKVDDRAHLVFLDGSALTIGPSSDLVIDRFVYDPNTRTGDIAVNVSRGAFRFVGGAISKQKDVVVQTPSATVGIRGGIAIVSIGADGSTAVSFLYGQSAYVSNRFGTSRVYRPGSQILAPANGAPLSPTLLPPGALQPLLARLEPSAAQAGSLGNDQTINGLVNTYNATVGLQAGNGGPSDFANTVRTNALQGANAVNQARLLAFPGQLPPSSSGGTAAAVTANSAPMVPSAGPPIIAPPLVVPPPLPPSRPSHHHHHHRHHHHHHHKHHHHPHQR